jgi:hypothetical protein
MIVAGRVVFTNRMESQALEDCEIPFSHALECEARDEIQKSVGCTARRPRLRARIGRRCVAVSRSTCGAVIKACLPSRAGSAAME